MYALRAGQLFDGESALGPGTVVVDEGRIVSVSPGVADDAIYLGDDVTLLPGLIDTHVHLVFDCSPAAADTVQTVSDDELAGQIRARARTALTAGVTTMRDLGDRRFITLPLREELARELAAGPRLLCAGPPVTTAKGHCWFLGGGLPEHPDHDQLRAAVAERADRGVDAIKVMATGGEMTPGSHSHLEQFTADELRVLVAAAHDRGLPVAAHAHGAAGIRNALAARVDTIEHCSFMGENGVEAHPDLLAELAASDVIVSTTAGTAPGDHPPPPPRIAALLPHLVEHLREMLGSGLTYTVGSDAGIAPIKPHDVLPYGAVWLADLGVAPAAALAAGTSVAARACR
ncbi:MAG: amidohydrolase family protein, partial [Micromonosporaceae bacterium]